MQLLLDHYYRSSSPWRVRWALALKGLPYEARAINLLSGEQRDATYVNRDSPLGVVPCLHVDGRPLTESVAIVEWLDEVQPEPPLFPEGAWARARTRQLVEFVNAGIQPLQNLRVHRHVSKELETQRSWNRHWTTLGLGALERELALLRQEGIEGAFAMGASISAADLFIVPQLYNARRFEIDLESYPLLRALETAALETAAARASHPDRFAPE